MFYTWYLNFLGQEFFFLYFKIKLWKSLEKAGFAHIHLLLANNKLLEHGQCLI